MSVLCQYQGLPPGCGFIELVRGRSWANPCSISFIQSRLRSVAAGERCPYPDDADEVVLWNWCREALQRFPDISQRQLDIHKCYGWLGFVLSAEVRKSSRWPRPGPTDPRTWNDPESSFDQLSQMAFTGAPQIAPGVCGGQGYPVRLIDRRTVNDLGLCLAALELDEVKPRLLELAELNWIAAWDVDRSMAMFINFQQFFAEAAHRGEDVLGLWD